MKTWNRVRREKENGDLLLLLCQGEKEGDNDDDNICKMLFMWKGAKKTRDMGRGSKSDVKLESSS